MKSDPPFVVSRSIAGDRLAAAMLRGGPGTSSSKAPIVVELWRALVSRWPIVLLATLLALVLSLAAIRTLVPQYRSTATLLIEQSRPRIVSIDSVDAGVLASREHFVTQSEFLRSRNVALRVMRSLQLADDPTFFGPPPRWTVIDDAVGALRRLLMGSAGPASPATGEPGLTEPQRRVLQVLERNLDVQPVRASQLLAVSFEHTDPAMAARVANAFVAAYVEADLDVRNAAMQQANGWLSERVTTLRKGLSDAEQALQAYRERTGTIDRQSSAQGGSVRQLEEAAKRLVEARTTRAQAEKAYGQAVSTNAAGALLLGSDAVVRANEARADARRRLVDVGQRLGRAHPEYLAAEADVAAAERALRQVTDGTLADLRKTLEVARAAERQLENTISSARGAIQGQNRDDFEFANYERDVAMQRQLYETFLGRLRETTAAGGIQAPVARLVDPAIAADTPSRPNKSLFVAASVMLGLLAGVAIAVLLHRYDARLRNVDDAEARLDLPVIGALPRLAPGEAPKAHRLLLTAPDSAYAEAIRSLRTALLLTGPEDRTRVVLVTSASSGEGRSTVAFNLALAASQVGRTLLIEADLRRPVHAQRMGLAPQRAGLTDLLAAQCELKQAIKASRASDLHVMTGGSRLEQPLELLSSRRFATVMATLRDAYDTIVIDSPSFGPVSDAAILARHATAALFVVRAGTTVARTAARALRAMEAAGVPLLGVVVNGIDTPAARRGTARDDVRRPGGYGGYAQADRPAPTG